MQPKYNLPDSKGHFGVFGGNFSSETLVHALKELKDQYVKSSNDPDFLAEFEHDLKHYVGRSTPLYHAQNLSQKLGGAQIYL
nr:tryptophan synthase subunit beta [Pseudomonadota bacterium]